MAPLSVARLEFEQAIKLALKFARVSLHRVIGEIGPAAADLARTLQELLELWGEHGVTGINCVLRVADQVGKADLVFVGVIALRRKTIGEPHLGLRPVEELYRHDLTPCWGDHVSHGRRRAEYPLPMRLSLDAGRGLVAGDDGAVADGLVDCFSALGKRLGSARQHVGYGAFRNLQPEQAVQHLGQPCVADHLAAVQIGDQRDDAWAERRAARPLRGTVAPDGLAAPRTITLVQLVPSRQRPEWRDLDVVVGVREHLTLEGYLSTAVAALGKVVAGHVGVGTELARDSGTPFAALLLPTRFVRDIGLLPA